MLDLCRYTCVGDIRRCAYSPSCSFWSDDLLARRKFADPQERNVQFLAALDLENTRCYPILHCRAADVSAPTTNLRWGFLGRSQLKFLQVSSSRCLDGLDYDDALLHGVA